MKNARTSLAFAALTVAAFAAMPAQAAQKNIGVTSFDTISIQGDFIVTVTETTGSSVVANGDSLALEALDVRVDSRRTLVIREMRVDNKPRGATNVKRKPIQITIRASGLSGISMMGNGRLTVTGIREPEAFLTLRGNGALVADKLNSRNVTAALDGAGTMTVIGKTQALDVRMAGAGSMDMRGFAVSDLIVRANGNGVGNFIASRRAEVNASGLGTVTVTGRAACKVNNEGLGDVYCGAASKAPAADDAADTNAGVIIGEES